MDSKSQPRPYKDFFMPMLHRRFTGACFYTFIICYTIAIWLGDCTDYLWSWFPIGPVGLRASLLCIPALLVYLLRIAQWHVGRRNTRSPLATLTAYALTERTCTTFAVYILSAFFYGEVCIWSRAGAAGLQVTDPGKLHERVRLNERPVYIRFLFLVLALGQSAMHIWMDYDRVPVPMSRTDRPTADPKRELLHKLVPLVAKAGVMATSTFAMGTTLYFVCLRRWFWNMWYSVMKHVFSLGKSPEPTGLAPFIRLAFMFVMQGALLSLLWQFCNTAFDVYMAQEPLKNGLPITADSKDPNGSLLVGLKSKKEDNKNTAFWELALITERFPERRIAIYEDLDRKKGPTHKQVTDVCVAELNAIIRRIEATTGATSSSDQDKTKQTLGPLQLVPRISEPLKDGQIMGPGNPPETRLQKIEDLTSQIARTHSSPQNAQNSRTRAFLKKGQENVNQGVSEVVSVWENYKDVIARSPVGWFICPSLRRRANATVLGEPFSRQAIISNAITALTNLSISSLKDDEHGRYQDEVPEIVRVFTRAIKAIEQYKNSLQVHWADAETLALPEAERRKIPELDQVVNELRGGLGRILGSFNEFLGGLGMTRAEIQEAKLLVAPEGVIRAG